MLFLFKQIDHVQLAMPKDEEDKARKYFDMLGF
jgi:hypothetical protein